MPLSYFGHTGRFLRPWLLGSSELANEMKVLMMFKAFLEMAAGMVAKAYSTTSEMWKALMTGI